METNKAAYDLEERILKHSAWIIRLTESMINSQAAKSISNLLLRSGTAPMAHQGEAQAGELPKDFIHKLQITLKEARGTSHWVKIAQRVLLVTKPGLLSKLLDETVQLIQILHSSICTAKQTP